MNSGQHAHQDLPDDAAEDVTDDSDSEGGQAEDDDSDSGLLQRSQEAIDEARDAARDALKETLPDDEDCELHGVRTNKKLPILPISNQPPDRSRCPRPTASG